MFYSNGAYSLFKVDTPVISGGATPPSFQDIYSYEFDGVDDKVILTQVSRNGVFTFSYWFKFTGTFNVNTECFIWGCYDNNSSYIKLVSNTQVILKLNGTQYTITESGGNNIPQNTWSNFTLIRNASNSVQLYLDGNTFGSPISSGNTFTFSSFGRIINNSFGFKGLIDESSLFYSDQTSDVATIYNSGVPNNLNDLSTPPLSWWRMGESANWDGSNWTLTDQGSGGNDATTQNMAEASRVLDVPPNPWTNTLSTSFDGIDDYVDMGNNLNFERTNAFSISCWFKRTRSGVSEFLVAKQDSTSNSRGYTLLIPFDDNKVTFVIRNNTALSGRLIVDCTTAITDTNWHNIIMTYDGSSNVSGINLYLDGNNDTGVTSGTLSATISNTANFQIGAKNGSNEFSGNIDEVAVFNSELSQSDVTTIYNSGVPNDISSMSGLVSFWRMGDGSVYPTINDEIGSNDGTMTNMSSANFVSDVPT